MADMSPKYRKYVQGFTKHLRHRDVEKRRKAARMVGELGAAETIETLLKMAESDPDATVRKNATYSLGMFAAFRDAMEGDDDDKQQEAIQAITRVMQTGQVGKPAKFSVAKLRPVLLSLVGVLVLLLAVNAAVFLGVGNLSAGDGNQGTVVDNPDETNTAPNRDRTELVSIGEARISQLSLNADKLQAIYESVDEAGNPELNQCLLPYDSTEPVAISNDDRRSFAQIARVYDGINQTAEQFRAARTRVEQACFDEIPLTSVDAVAPIADIDEFRDNAATWRDVLAQADASPTPPPTNTPPPATNPSVENAVTVEPTVPVNIRPYVAEASDIIDRTGIRFVAQTQGGGRGPAVLLEQYWQEAASNAGVTDGCRNSALSVPPLYTPSNEDDFAAAVAAEPNLQLAINQMNTGLEILQQQVDAFRTACNGGAAAVLNSSQAGINTLAQAKVVLIGAEEQLNALLAN